MKLIRNILITVFFFFGCFVSSRVCAQTSDYEAQLAALEATTPMAAADAPETGTFYSAQNPDSAPAPANVNGVPVWPMGDGFYLLDDLVAESAAMSRGGGMQTMSMDPNDPSDGDTNSYTPNFAPLFSPTTNDLWLQLILKTNTSAYLVIHPPWNVTNGVYDLLYTTNLALPVSWQWVLRTAPGQTNLIVTNALDAQGFYRLGAPNDLVANDSLGTNFWFAYMFSYWRSPALGKLSSLSLYISSPETASGTVSIPGLFTNDPTMTATGCGDASVNGTYVLTSLTAQETEDWEDTGFLDPANPSYVNGTNWVNFDQESWLLFSYDPVARQITFLYDKSGVNLNSSDVNLWYLDDGLSPPPTTTCLQHPFPLSVPFSVTAGGATNVAITTSNVSVTNVMIFANDQIQTQGIHITATAPVAVYAWDYIPTASAAFTCYPTPLLGTNYCIMSRPSLDGGNSEFAIVATASNTTVTITPSTNADLGGYLWTNPIVLQQGQTYQVQSYDNAHDVTGTRVTADKPIAVFAGADLAYVPDASTVSANPLVQEQLPVDSWGTQALSMGFAGRTNGDSYWVLAAYDNTVITITGAVVTVVDESAPPWVVTITNETVVVTNQAGQFYDLIVAGPVQFQASHPIQVAHFANGTYFDHGNNPFEGDPCEILLTPPGHYLGTNIIVTLPDDNIKGDFYENYLNLIVAQTAITSTWLDGSLVAATNFVVIGTSGYYGAQLSVSNGVHKITSSQPVGVEVYGFGYQDAYGYFGGTVK